MSQFTQRLVIAWSKHIHDQLAVTGRAIEYITESAKLTAADRSQSQILTVSANLSAVSFVIAPLGVSAPAAMLLLVTDNPIDIRVNASSDSAFLSGVQLWAMTGHVSNIFVTTGSSDTVVMMSLVGGSNATIGASLPLP